MADRSSRLGIYDELENQRPKNHKARIVLGVLILVALVVTITVKVVF